MIKDYEVGKSYPPEDFDYKEFFLEMRRDKVRQYKYENAVSVYRFSVEELDSLFQVNSVLRRSFGKTESVKKFTAIVESLEERVRRSGI